jgi:Txe/YoeB family toxin of Txe-Axe toxin-antitoxin module
MEPTKRVRKYAEDDIFYSDSEAEQDLNTSLKAVSSSKTAFKMGHTVGVQDAVACVMEQEKTCEGTQPGAIALSVEIARDVATARTQTRYAQRYTEQVMDTLELVRRTNGRLVRKVADMERNARYQELRWRNMLEKVRVQEHIIEELSRRIQEQNVSDKNSEENQGNNDRKVV